MSLEVLFISYNPSYDYRLFILINIKNNLKFKLEATALDGNTVTVWNKKDQFMKAFLYFKFTVFTV